MSENQNVEQVETQVAVEETVTETVEQPTETPPEVPAENPTGDGPESMKELFAIGGSPAPAKSRPERKKTKKPTPSKKEKNVPSITKEPKAKAAAKPTKSKGDKGKPETDGKTPKAAKPAPESNGKAPVKDGGIKGPRLRILQAVAKAGRGLTRGEISEATGIGSGFTSLLGHLEADRREEGSLSKLGFLSPKADDVDGKQVVVWNLTAAGRKAMEKASK